MKLRCCTADIKKTEVWFLKDIEQFEARKIVYGKCPKCHRPVISLIEKRISDGVLFIDDNISGNDAIRILKREAKRIICKQYKIEANTIQGWIYGHNVQIKNRLGEVIKIRQYASDFNNRKTKVKEILIT